MNHMPRFLDYRKEPLPLDDPDRPYSRAHVFEDEDVDAVNAALGAGRPLLLRGAPGTGKSQLALAAAVGLERAFVSSVIDARTESRDLLWRFDAVRRLADAQVGASAPDFLKNRRLEGGEGQDVLHERFYVEPGPLWWGLNWARAADHADKAGLDVPKQREGMQSENGVVVLLDEIDKADSALPNGLLGALGDGTFSVPGVGRIACGDVPPLVVITTNEERTLPSAFLRRCAVHHLALPGDAQRLGEWLLRLGRAHFPELCKDDETVLVQAVEMLLEDRAAARRSDLHPPGSAEYLDLLRVVATHADDATPPGELLASARRFLLQKHPPGEAR